AVTSAAATLPIESLNLRVAVMSGLMISFQQLPYVRRECRGIGTGLLQHAHGALCVEQEDIAVMHNGVIARFSGSAAKHLHLAGRGLQFLR
uniref:hypothetical protein n=1 Tax=Mammaliicoccus sciuri TaxID=1296 RepID=UPI0028A0D8E3